MKNEGKCVNPLSNFPLTKLKSLFSFFVDGGSASSPISHPPSIVFAAGFTNVIVSVEIF